MATWKTWTILGCILALTACRGETHDDNPSDNATTSDTGTGTQDETDTQAPTDTGDDPTDTGDDPTDTGAEPATGVMLGQIEISVSGWGGQWDAEANVRADFYDSPVRMEAFAPFAPGQHEKALEQGGCVLWLPDDDAQCNPPCDWDEYCGSGGDCVTAPQRVSAGDITVAAGTSSVVIHPADWGYDGGSLPRSALGPSATITAVAQGGTLAAFELATNGLAPPAFELDESNTLVLEDGKDNRIAFAAQEHGIVRLVLNKGWHGSLPEATLMCEAPATSGELVIPRALVEAFPGAGGAGLEPHMSWIALISRDRAELTNGPVELVVAFKRYLYPSHAE